MAKKNNKSNSVSLKWAQNHPLENAQRLAKIRGEVRGGSAAAAGLLGPQPPAVATPAAPGGTNPVQAMPANASIYGTHNGTVIDTTGTQLLQQQAAQAALTPPKNVPYGSPGYDWSSKPTNIPPLTLTPPKVIAGPGVSTPVAPPVTPPAAPDAAGAYGGRTTDQLLEQYRDQSNIAQGEKGFDYASMGAGAPTFTNTYIANTGHAFAGYYQNTHDGLWYPINQGTLAAGSGNGNSGGGRGGNGGGGSGGDGGSTGAGGTIGYNVENAPNWWSGIAIQNPSSAQQEANMLNAAIPFMSPEDQQAAATYLASNFSEFAGYKNIAYGDIPSSLTTDVRDRFTSRTRATQYLDTLTAIAEALGKTEAEMGSGYTFLKNVGTILNRFGGGEVGTNDRQTREQYTQMLTALDPVLNQASQSGSGIAGYSPIAQYLTSPTFSAGNLVNVTKNSDGTYSFGSPSGSLY